MTTSTKITPSDERWDACPPGALRRMVSEVRESRRRAVMQRATGALAVLLLAAASVWLGYQVLNASLGQERFAKLTCAEVQVLLSKYGHGVLAASLEEKIGQHLDHCDHCHALYRKKRPSPDRKQTRCENRAPLLAARGRAF